jgi:PAS domain S-box-containing protein
VIQSVTEYSIIAKDPDGAIQLWNEGACRLYGYRADEVIGKSADMLHPPEDIAQGLPQKMREQALHTGKWEGVIGRITKDALRLTCRVVITPRIDSTGKAVGYILMSKDVTTEYHMRDRMVRSKLIDPDEFGPSPEDLLEFIITLLQASTEYSIVATAIDGRIVLWNEGARRLYGYEPDDVVGRANIELLHTEADRQAGLVHQILGSALQNRFWAGDVERRRRNGEGFFSRLVVTPRVDANRRLLGFLFISHEKKDQ